MRIIDPSVVSPAQLHHIQKVIDELGVGPHIGDVTVFAYHSEADGLAAA